MFMRDFFRRLSPWRSHAVAMEKKNFGRTIFGLQFHFKVARGSAEEAVKEANEFCTQFCVSSFQIKDLPMDEAERARLAMNPEAPRRWGLFFLVRETLETDSVKEVGDSQHLELFKAASPEALQKVVNPKIRGREVLELQFSYDPHAGESARWFAVVSYPYSLRQQRTL